MFDSFKKDTKHIKQPYLKSRPKTFLRSKRREQRPSVSEDAARLLGRAVTREHTRLPVVTAESTNTTTSFSASSLWSSDVTTNNSAAVPTTNRIGSNSIDIDNDYVSQTDTHKPLLLVDTNCPFRASTARQFESEIEQSFPLPHSAMPTESSVVYSHKQATAGPVVVQLRYHESVPGAYYGSTDEPAAFCELLVSEQQLVSLRRNTQHQRNMQLYLSEALEKYFHIPNDRYYLRFLNRRNSSIVAQSFTAATVQVPIVAANTTIGEEGW